MADSDFEDVTREFASAIEGVVRLTSVSSEAVLRSSPQDAIRSIVPHMQENTDQYGEYFAKQKKKDLVDPGQ